mmetsp:Transcript_24175/g.56170  ORF Transcript_24175/g.56170 Transcript_24175/m.56170 type:complete len:236 (-) Transcript_24175:352-1059(-)
MPIAALLICRSNKAIRCAGTADVAADSCIDAAAGVIASPVPLRCRYSIASNSRKLSSSSSPRTCARSSSFSARTSPDVDETPPVVDEVDDAPSCSGCARSEHDTGAATGSLSAASVPPSAASAYAAGCRSAADASVAPVGIGGTAAAGSWLCIMEKNSATLLAVAASAGACAGEPLAADVVVSAYASAGAPRVSATPADSPPCGAPLAVGASGDSSAVTESDCSSLAISPRSLVE